MMSKVPTSIVFNLSMGVGTPAQRTAMMIHLAEGWFWDHGPGPYADFGLDPVATRARLEKAGITPAANLEEVCRAAVAEVGHTGYRRGNDDPFRRAG